MLLKCLLLCAVQLISHICLAGNTLYVNPDGKENAAGTADDPCKTLVEVMKAETSSFRRAIVLPEQRWKWGITSARRQQKCFVSLRY